MQGPPPIGAPPPLPGGAPQAGGMAPLFVIFNGQKFPVSKDEFHHRSLAPRPPTCPSRTATSRAGTPRSSGRTAAGTLKDLGSTNGVEFQGRKIDSKRIEEGDVYQLCDYEIRFTYR